jgi:fructose-1,6-bisphosphatase
MALAEMSIEELTKWYKHVFKLQQMLNFTYQRSINTTLFELLIGTKMKTKEDLTIKEVEHKMINHYDYARKQLRDDARKPIEKVQQENKKHYNLRRRNLNKSTIW